MKTKLIIVILVAVLFFGAYSLLREKNDNKPQQLLQACRTLRLGMTTETMLKTMREAPISKVKRGDSDEMYFFESPKAASAETAITISDGKIKDTLCGEEYHWWYKEVNGKPVETLSDYSKK